MIIVYHANLGEKRRNKEDLYKGKRNFQGIKVTVFFFLTLTFMALKSYF